MSMEIDQVIRIRKDHLTLGEYHWGPRERKPFFHPLYIPPIEEAVTCFRPWDHIWHTGVWFAWKYLNGINFWEEGPTIHDPLGRSIAVSTSSVKESKAAVKWTQQLEWRTDGGDHLLTEERRLIFWHHIPNGTWAIDWESAFTAMVPVELDRTDPTNPETTWGGYGGLFMRLSRAFWEEECFLDSEKRTDRSQIHGQSARWVDQCGRADGTLESREQWAGVAILDHPHNLHHPTPWYTLPWLTGPAPLYRAPLTLSQNERLPLRYRVFAHQGQGTYELLETAYQEWLDTDLE
jgi:hypothetical protein